MVDPLHTFNRVAQLLGQVERVLGFGVRQLNGAELSE